MPTFEKYEQYIFRLGISHTSLESRSLPSPKRNLRAMIFLWLGKANKGELSPNCRG